jgi:hypothetical protein
VLRILTLAAFFALLASTPIAGYAYALEHLEHGPAAPDNSSAPPEACPDCVAAAALALGGMPCAPKQPAVARPAPERASAPAASHASVRVPAPRSRDPPAAPGI